MKVSPLPERFDEYAFVIACDSGRQQVPERTKVAWRKLRRIYDQTHRTGQNRLHYGMKGTVLKWENDKHRRWKDLRSKALTAGREEGPKPTMEWRELIDDLMSTLQDLSRDECAMLRYLIQLHHVKSGHCALRNPFWGNACADTMLLSSVIDSL